MTEKLKQLIEKEISRIPPEGQEIIAASDWVRITREIGEKFLLDEEEVVNLQIETLLALIGTTDLRSYSINIENQVGTTTETAEKISNEVFEKIFRPINEKLTESIKNSEKIHTAGAEQNLDFILSGGDYFAFLKDGEQRERDVVGEEESEDKKINVKII